MATGFRSLHRRMGATIIAAGLANIFQGMYLLCVPLWVQIGQVVLIALVLIGYVLYRPPAAKRPAGAGGARRRRGGGGGRRQIARWRHEGRPDQTEEPP